MAGGMSAHATFKVRPDLEAGASSGNPTGPSTVGFPSTTQTDEEVA